MKKMYDLKRAVRNDGNRMKQQKKGTMEYLTFPLLENTGMVKHLFTTRTGGFSEGMFSSLNLNFDRGDDPEKVRNNYERVAEVLDCSINDFVLSQQTHTTNIRLVDESDKGNGIFGPSAYQDVDGLITNTKGIVLVTSYADCVPLYFVDPVKEAIGLAHSGWKGTVGRMGKYMIRAMQEQFGSNPEDILVAIGPSICQDCYEVSEEVANAFLSLSGELAQYEEEILESGYRGGYQGNGIQMVSPGVIKGKYQLDLWLANAVILRNAGILLSNIAITDVCTCHNPEYLFSHRASEGKRGNLSAFLGLQ